MVNVIENDEECIFCDELLFRDTYARIQRSFKGRQDSAFSANPNWQSGMTLWATAWSKL